MTSRRLPEKEFILIEWFVEGEQCAIYRLSEDGSERLLGSFVSRGQLEDGKAFPLALSDGSTVRVQMQDGEPRVLKNDSLLLPVSVPDRLAIEWHARHGKKNNSEVTPAIAAATIGIVGVFFLIAGILSYIFGGSGVFGLGPSGLLLANIVLGLVFFLLAWLAYRGLFFTAMLARIIYVPVSVIGIIYALYIDCRSACSGSWSNCGTWCSHAGVGSDHEYPCTFLLPCSLMGSCYTFFQDSEGTS